MIYGYHSQKSLRSSSNSSISPLLANETFTGVSDLNDEPQVGVSCFSDTDGTLYFDFSVNGSDWRTFPSGGFGVSASIHEFHTAVKLGRYFRVRFVNGSSNQSTFQLFTYYGAGILPSSTPLNQSVGLDHDAVITRSTVPQDEIRVGRRTGVTGWTKFGFRDGLTA